MRFMFTAAALVLGTVSVQAATDLSGLRCDEPELVSLMLDAIRGSTTDDGKTIAEMGANVEGISKSTTLEATPSKVVCQIVVNIGFAGRTETIRSRYTIQQQPNGDIIGTLQMLY